MLCIFPHIQAEAQVIAVIKSHNVEPFNRALAGFVAACNYHITKYDLRGSKRRGRKIVKRIMATKPKLILAIGALAAQAVKQKVRDIPVVFFMVPNPHKYGLGQDNMAGISLDIPVEPQFATYKSLLPPLRTIGVIVSKNRIMPPDFQRRSCFMDTITQGHSPVSLRLSRSELCPETK